MGSRGPPTIVKDKKAVVLSKEVILWVNNYFCTNALAQANSKYLMYTRGAEGEKPPFDIVLKSVLFALNRVDPSKEQ